MNDAVFRRPTQIPEIILFKKKAEEKTDSTMRISKRHKTVHHIKFERGLFNGFFLFRLTNIYTNFII
jgi:hypothetical protein